MRHMRPLAPWLSPWWYGTWGRWGWWSCWWRWAWLERRWFPQLCPSEAAEVTAAAEAAAAAEDTAAAEGTAAEDTPEGTAAEDETALQLPVDLDEDALQLAVAVIWEEEEERAAAAAAVAADPAAPDASATASSWQHPAFAAQRICPPLDAEWATALAVAEEAEALEVASAAAWSEELSNAWL